MTACTAPASDRIGDDAARCFSRDFPHRRPPLLPPPYDLYTVVAPVAAGRLSGVLVECLPGPSLPNRSVGRAPNGNFVLTSVEAEVSAPGLKVPLKVLVRGQYDRRGTKVTPGLPAALPPLPAGARADRLGFARWVASADNPLTARVWVNRAWEHFFGAGLVRTTENLGTQAEFPSHPELLDWLATEFVRIGWDMKAAHKLVVMSAAYRQPSRVTPELLTRDPENRLLARGPRFRLPGELVRDQALAASGVLTTKIGGPSVRPYMPAGVWDEVSVYGDLRNYKMDPGPDRHRRTMYTVWKRTAAPPTMLLFDAPNREVCTVRRSRTNTPLQALGC